MSMGGSRPLLLALCFLALVSAAVAAGASTAIRTGGGSIPDGEPVTGYVVPPPPPPPDGPRAAAAADGSGAVVTLCGPDGVASSVEAGDGVFVFGSPKVGDSTLAVSLNGLGLSTDIRVEPADGERCQLVLFLGADGGATGSDGDDWFAISPDTTVAADGSQATVTADLTTLSSDKGPVVWVMYTSTDAVLLPGLSPSDVVLVPGSASGPVRIQAYSGQAESDEITVEITDE
jgi:hypothetical protein